MIRLLPIIAFLFCVSSGAQTWNQAESLTNLLTRPPVVGGWYSVKGYRVAGDWGDERTAQYVRGDTTTTNAAHVFNWSGGRLKFFDATNSVQDARWWPIVGDGSTSDATALNAAASHVRGLSNATLVLPARRFYVPGGINLSGVRLSARGSVLVPDGTNYAWTASGTNGTFRSLSANADKGASTLTSTNLAAEVSVGSFIKIISDADFADTDPDRPQGEIAQVVAVSSPTITLSGPLFDSYTTANNARAAVVTMTTVDDGGLTVEAPDYNASTAPTPLGAYIAFANRPVVTGRYVNCSEAGIRIFDSFSPQILNAQVLNSFRSGVGNGDALFVGNATMFATVVGGTFQGNRAGIDIGGNESGGVAWETKVSGAELSNHPSSTQNGGTEHSSVGSTHWIDCTVRGSAASQRAIGVAGRRSTIRNLTVIGAPYAIYSGSDYARTESLDASDIRMVDPVASGNPVTLTGQFTDLRIAGVRGSYGGGVGLLVNAATTIGRWDLSGFSTTNGVGVLVLSGATTPARLTLRDSSFEFPTQSAISYAVRFLDSDVTDVTLVGVTQNKTAGLLYMDGSASDARITIIGASSTSPQEHHILSDSSLDTVWISDSYFGDSVSSASIISASAISKIGMQGVKTEGANITKIVNGAITSAFDVGNGTHIALPGNWASGTVSAYSIPLGSSGAIPFAITADTTSSDHLSSFRAITSGKARVYIGGRNTTTSGYTFGGGGGDLTLQNLNTTDGNFTQIANLDATGGQYNSGIVFLNEKHSADHGSLRFYTRAGGSQPVEAGYWATNGVLVPSFGVNLSGTTRTTWPSAISDISGLQSALDIRQLTNAHLTSVSALASNGILARTASGAVSSRHIVGGTQISVADGDGVGGNPTLGINNDSITTNQVDSAFRALLGGSGGGGISGIRVSDGTTDADGITNILFNPAGGSGFAITVTDMGTRADVDFEWLSPGFGINGTFPTYGTDRWNINDSTPAAPSVGVNVKWQTTSTNVSAYVPLSTVATFKAQDGEPPTSSYATFSTRNSIGVMLFDPAAQEAMRYRFVLPYGYSAANATVVLKWTTSATSGDARWGARFMALTGDIDSDSFATAVEGTTTTSATAGTVMTTTLSAVGLDSAVAGDGIWLEVYRDVGDAADTINSNDLELHSVEVRVE